MRKNRMSKRRKQKLLIVPFVLLLSVFSLAVLYLIQNKDGFIKKNNVATINNNTLIEKESTEASTTPQVEKEYKLTSVGNILVHGKQIEGAKTSDGSYNFDESFQFLDEYIAPSDLSIAVLEGAFKGGTPSGYPLFNIPDDFLKSMEKTGFDLINLSTNHVVDHGMNGLLRTISTVEDNSLTPVGVRETASHSNYTIDEVDGHKVGFFSYTYKTGENSINGITIPNDLEELVNAFSYDKLDVMYSEIEDIVADMEKNDVELIVASIHWGEEYITSANASQKEIAKKFNELGIDIVLGNHPHVVQPFEVISGEEKSTFVVYGQGNILSNQCYEELGNRLTEDGTMIEFTLGVKDDKLYLKGYEVIPTWVHRYVGDDSKYNHVIIPLNEALKSPSDFNLSGQALDRAQKSFNDTSSIVGADSLGYKQFK